MRLKRRRNKIQSLHNLSHEVKKRHVWRFYWHGMAGIGPAIAFCKPILGLAALQRAYADAGELAGPDDRGAPPQSTGPYGGDLPVR